MSNNQTNEQTVESWNPKAGDEVLEVTIVSMRGEVVKVIVHEDTVKKVGKRDIVLEQYDKAFDQPPRHRLDNVLATGSGWHSKLPHDFLQEVQESLGQDGVIWGYYARPKSSATMIVRTNVGFIVPKVSAQSEVIRRIQSRLGAQERLRSAMKGMLLSLDGSYREKRESAFEELKGAMDDYAASQAPSPDPAS